MMEQEQARAAAAAAAAERKEAAAPQPPAATPEQRRANREAIGAEAMQKYLEPSSEDQEAVRRLKGDLAGKDLEQSVGVLLGGADQQRISDVLAELGISRDQADKWRLRNPDPEQRDSLPGSYAKEEHLKAFLSGFVEAGTLRDKVKVIHEVYRYLGLPVPELEEMLPEEPASPPAERPKPAAPEQIPLSKWKSVFSAMKKHTRGMSLAIGLVTLFGIIDQERPSEKEAPPAPPAVTMVEDAPAGRIDIKEGEQQTLHVMKKGDTVDGVVRSMLGGEIQDEAEVKALVTQVLDDNNIRDGWYGTTGDIDSTKMPVGSIIDVTVVAKKIGELRQMEQVRQDLNPGK